MLVNWAFCFINMTLKQRNGCFPELKSLAIGLKETELGSDGSAYQQVSR